MLQRTRRRLPRIEIGYGLAAQEIMRTKFHFASDRVVAAILSLLVWTTGAATLWAQSPCGAEFPHDSNPTPITDEEVCNFHRVEAMLYRGGRPHPGAYLHFTRLGIRTVISLEESRYAAQEREDLRRFDAGVKPQERITFMSFPINQDQISRTGLEDQDVKRLFQLIRSAPKPAFIHCYYGRDRTGAVVALYRMAFEGVPYSSAYQEAVHYGFSPEDLGLVRTLDRFRNPKRLRWLSGP